MVLSCGARCSCPMLFSLLTKCWSSWWSNPLAAKRSSVSLAHYQWLFNTLTHSHKHTHMHGSIGLHNTSSSYTRKLTPESWTRRCHLAPRLCVYLLLHSRILSLLFVVWLCVLDSLSVYLPLHPLPLQFLPLFSHFFFFFWLSHHLVFLPPTSPWLSTCVLFFLLCHPSFLFVPLLISLSLSHPLSLSLSLHLLPPSLPPALGGKLQSQLLVLELFQAHHDGILVDAGLSSPGHQSHTHQLLVHTPDQLRRAHGARGGQGRRFSPAPAGMGGMGEIKGLVVHHLISGGWQGWCADFQ